MESEKYTIGDYEFDTEEEWADAVDDLQTIRQIMNTTDVHNPDEALSLYRMMRDGELVFKGPVGEAFFNDIADTVAEISEKSLKKEKDEGAQDPLSVKSLFRRFMFNKNKISINNTEADAEKIKKRKTRSQWVYLLAGVACVAIAAGCFLYYAWYEYSEMLNTRALTATSEKKSITEAVNWYLFRKENGLFAQDYEGDSDTEYFGENATETTEEQPKEILAEYTLLHEQYPDLAGWLTIDGTDIDLPVMQTSDNDYYLHVNMDGEDDKNGTLFLDYRTDLMHPGSNFIIYGHNMKSGAMFGGLKQFLDEDYARAHQTIEFDTIYEKQTFEVIAVCLSQVEYQDENAYRYYDFTYASNEEEFKKYTDAMDDSAVVKLADDPEYGDTLLTLSTCNSYVEDGRLYVVAVKRNSDDRMSERE